MKEEFKPKAFDVIFWLTEEGKVDPHQLFDFLELYWPTFLEKDGNIFLREKFDEEEYNRLYKDKINSEFWINLLTLDDFFNNSENSENEAITFSQKLAEIWKVKLEKDFPSLEFTVKCLEDEECGDYGLTFYQTKNET